MTRVEDWEKGPWYVARVNVTTGLTTYLCNDGWKPKSEATFPRPFTDPGAADKLKEALELGAGQLTYRSDEEQRVEYIYSVISAKQF